MHGLVELLTNMTNLNKQVFELSIILRDLCFDYIFLSTLQCYDFSRNSIPFLVCRSVDFDHVKPSLVHDFFWIKSIGKIQLEQFQNVLLVDVYKKCQNKSRKNWHSLTLDAFFEYMYKV